MTHRTASDRSAGFVGAGRANAFAHRGDRAGFPPGNRASAFERAVEVGFDHIETDAHVTRDGRIVLFHDDRLDGETTGTGEVHDHDWSTLSELRYRAGDNVCDEGLMLLEDALERWPSVYWNIDAKTSATVEPLVDIVRRLGVADRVLLTSFVYRDARRLRKRAGPGVATGLSRTELAGVRLASWVGAPIPRLGDAAQVPTEHRGVTIVDERFVETCHDAGIAVHVWTIDSPDEMHRLLDLGVDGIISDHPRRLRSVLEDRGEWQ